jgi:hypothetical protein
MADDKQIEQDEERMREFEHWRKIYVERAQEHRDARLNLRLGTEWEHIVYEEMLFDVHLRLTEVEKLLKG